MEFASEQQRQEYEIEKAMMPTANFQQAGEKILVSWVQKYYRDGVMTTVHMSCYITKTGKTTRIKREKIG